MIPRTFTATLAAAVFGLIPALPLVSAPAAPAHLRVVARNNVPVGGGTNPGLTSLIAAYDFGDATDADGGTYNLAAQNTPTYTAGPPNYGTATDGTPDKHWNQPNLDNNWGNVDGDWSMVIRFRAYTSITNNDVVFYCNGGRMMIRYNTGGMNAFVSSTQSGDILTSTVSGALDTWFTCVITHDTDANTCSLSVNGETFVTDSSMTTAYAVGTAFFGAASSTNSNNIEIDFAFFWAKELTQDNVTWLYNSGGTRTYSQL